MSESHVDSFVVSTIGIGILFLLAPIWLTIGNILMIPVETYMRKRYPATKPVKYWTTFDPKSSASQAVMAKQPRRIFYVTS